MRWRSELAGAAAAAALIAASWGCSAPREQPLSVDGAAGAGGSGGSDGGATDHGGTGGTGGGDAGVDSGGGSFCAQQTRPTGVAATDYQCFDLDTPSSGISAWTPMTSTAMAMLAPSNARASSAPSSLLTVIPAMDASSTTPQVATLSWNAVGGSAIQKVVVTTKLNRTGTSGVTPPWMGSIELLCIEYGGGNACLSYTQGEDLQFQTAYTGYFINFPVVSGAARLVQCQVTGTLTANLWNPVVLEVDANGDAKVTMNGTASATCSTGLNLNDTTAQITIGPASVGTTNDGMTVYIDDTVAAVYR
jgi:hypothetical protein